MGRHFGNGRLHSGKNWASLLKRIRLVLVCPSPNGSLTWVTWGMLYFLLGLIFFFCKMKEEKQMISQVLPGSKHP